jgi:hypothetical protein
MEANNSHDYYDYDHDPKTPTERRMLSNEARHKPSKNWANVDSKDKNGHHSTSIFFVVHISNASFSDRQKP